MDDKTRNMFEKVNKLQPQRWKKEKLQQQFPHRVWIVFSCVPIINKSKKIEMVRIVVAEILQHLDSMEDSREIA